MPRDISPPRRTTTPSPQELTIKQYCNILNDKIDEFKRDLIKKTYRTSVTLQSRNELYNFLGKKLSIESGLCDAIKTLRELKKMSNETNEAFSNRVNIQYTLCLRTLETFLENAEEDFQKRQFDFVNASSSNESSPDRYSLSGMTLNDAKVLAREELKKFHGNPLVVEYLALDDAKKRPTTPQHTSNKYRFPQPRGPLGSIADSLVREEEERKRTKEANSDPLIQPSTFSPQ